MVTVVRLVVLLWQKHRKKNCDFMTIMAGSQIIQLQPGYRVKRHTLGFNCMDELALSELPERLAFHKQC